MNCLAQAEDDLPERQGHARFHELTTRFVDPTFRHRGACLAESTRRILKRIFEQIQSWVVEVELAGIQDPTEEGEVARRRLRLRGASGRPREATR